MQSQDRSLLPRPIAHIFFQACPQETQTELLARIPIEPGALLSEELLETTRRAVKTFDDRLEVDVNRALPPTAYLDLPPEIKKKVTPPAADDGVNVTIYNPAALPQRIRLEAGAMESMLLERVPPPATTDTRGTVHLAVVVAKDGTVTDAQPVDGPDPLLAPATAAVKQWRYRPTRLNGRPVEVLTTVEVRF